MATEGTREGGSSMNRGQGKYFDREKRPGGGTRNPIVPAHREVTDRQVETDHRVETETDHMERNHTVTDHMETDHREMSVQTETTEVLLSFRKRMRMRKTEAEEASHPVQRRVSLRSQFRTKIRSRCA